MTRDSDGRPLKVGDKVAVFCVIASVHDDGLIDVRVIDPNQHISLLLKAERVMKVD